MAERMKCGKFLFLIAYFLLAPAWGWGADSGTWISAGSYMDMHIVVGEAPSENIRYAAEAFKQQWKACTSKEIEFSASNEGLLNAWLGPAALPKLMIPDEDLAGLSSQSVFIRTFTPLERDLERGAARQLIITSGTDRGALYGVFSFFEHALRVRWLTPDCTWSPRARFTTQHVDYQYTPAFPYRATSYHELLAQRYTAEQMRAYQLAHRFGDLEGQPVCVTFMQPEAQPKEGVTPTCFSDPQTAKAMTRELLGLIRSTPKEPGVHALPHLQVTAHSPYAKMWRIAPRTAYTACQCPRCKALRAKEGTPAAPWLAAVNHLAEEVEQAFPDVDYRLQTTLVGALHTPPQQWRPHENVDIQLDNRDCDFSAPLEEGSTPENAAFVAHLKAWTKITAHVWVVDTVSSFQHALCPFPNLHVLQPNLRLYDEYEVEGVLARAWHAPDTPLAELDLLRNYLVSSLLWDPDLPVHVLLDEFCSQYYGPAGDAVQNYVTLLADAVSKDSVKLRADAPPQWFTPELLAKARALFEEVPTERLKDPYIKRFEQVQAPLPYVASLLKPNAS